MEVNRDEAERCIDIATAALTGGHPDKAQRFLEKAQRLFPTEKAKGELRWPSRRNGRFARGGAQHHHRAAASPASRMSSAAHLARACGSMGASCTSVCHNNVI